MASVRLLRRLARLVRRGLAMAGGVGLAVSTAAAETTWDGEDWLQGGPLIETFPLTLEEGRGTEALGPFYFREETETEVRWGIPPVYTEVRSKDGERRQVFVLPPIFSLRKYGEDTRWQLGQWFNSSRVDRIDDDNVRRFNIFPLFFYQDSPDPAQDYWALFPLYGHLKNRMFRDEAEFVLFPAWLKTRKGTMTTRNIAFPFIHFRDGPGLDGWQFWPLAGHEHKEPTTRTNVADEIEVVPGHDKTFVLWPLYFRNRLGLGTENPQKIDAFLPLYYAERSPARDHTSVIWPFVSWTDNREQKFRQWNLLWPLVGFARGEGKRLDRVAPFFSVGRSPMLDSDAYAWPLYRQRHLHTPEVERKRTQYGVFLYVDLKERNLETGQNARRIDSWPLFTWTRNPEGHERLQVLSIIEPIRRGAGIERNWSPLWSLWRSQRHGETGANSQSLLWNLYRRDEAEGVTKGSLLFGLVQYQKSPAGKDWRFFHFGRRPGGTPVDSSHVPEPR